MHGVTYVIAGYSAILKLQQCRSRKVYGTHLSDGSVAWVAEIPDERLGLPATPGVVGV